MLIYDAFKRNCVVLGAHKLRWRLYKFMKKITIILYQFIFSLWLHACHRNPTVSPVSRWVKKIDCKNWSRIFFPPFIPFQTHRLFFDPAVLCTVGLSSQRVSCSSFILFLYFLHPAIVHIQCQNWLHQRFFLVLIPRSTARFYLYYYFYIPLFTFAVKKLLVIYQFYFYTYVQSLLICYILYLKGR